MECNAMTFVFVLFLAITTVQGQRHLKNLEKLAIKTIESEDGDVIHCVDIYKQPALDHPLLQNHSIEMPPGSYQRIDGIQSSVEENFQVWQKSGSCPEGTIPIRKTTGEEDGAFINSFDAYDSTSRRLLQMKRKSKPTSRMEFAGLSYSPDRFYTGVRGRMSLWKPHVAGDERSGAAISIHGKRGAAYLGWMVRSQVFDINPQPRAFIAWEGEEGELCFNLDCRGFVQTSNQIALGGSLLEHEIGNVIPFEIVKDSRIPIWWAVVGTERLGYWPEELFRNLFPFESVRWAGFVQNTQINSKHSTTQMGNGQRPEKSKSAAFIDDISLITPSGERVPPLNPKEFVSFPRCYSAIIYGAKRTGNSRGMAVHYGGSCTKDSGSSSGIQIRGPGTKDRDGSNWIRNRE